MTEPLHDIMEQNRTTFAGAGYVTMADPFLH
jgi:hypothetical protein